jgi:hypothetical protein
MSEHHDVAAESYVVLDVGGDIGALALYCPADLEGAEIEISRAGEPRTHSLVRERRIGDGQPPQYAAVYPGLQAGEYAIWRPDDSQAGSVLVKGGEVASFEWR